MASSWGKILQGISGGAGIGSIIPGVGPLAGGIVGLGASLFGKSDEEIITERKNELQKEIRRITAERLQTGISEINKQTTSGLAMNKEAAARRALSLGHTGDAESFILPGQSKITNQGAQATRQFTTATKNAESDALLQTEQAYAGRPIEPSISDVLFNIGQVGINLSQQQQYLDNMSKSMLPGGTGSTPSTAVNGGYTVPGSGNQYDTFLNDSLKQSDNMLKGYKKLYGKGF